MNIQTTNLIRSRPIIQVALPPIRSTAIEIEPDYAYHIKLQLERFSFDDWDGDGAKAVSDESVNSAIKICYGLPYDITKPTFGAGYDGSVTITWSQPDMTCMLRVTDQDHTELAYTIPLNNNSFETRVKRGAERLIFQYMKPIYGFIWQHCISHNRREAHPVYTIATAASAQLLSFIPPETDDRYVKALGPEVRDRATGF